MGHQRRRILQRQQLSSLRKSHAAVSNLIEMFCHLRHRAGLTYTLGRMTGSQSHGWAVWGAMAVLFLAGVTVAYWAEARGNPLLHGVNQQATATQPGGNMEGKEVRFGITNSALFATVTTDASCGAINGWHDSFTPLGGMVPLVNIMLSEVIFGGVGAGMYGILDLRCARRIYRRPDGGPHAGISGQEDRSLRRENGDAGGADLSAGDSGVHRISSVNGFGTSSITNPGPHGFTQMLYAFTSGAGNNGSAFGGLNTNTLWYNTRWAFTMLIGRFFMIIPMLAIAGNLAQKKYVPPSLGTFPVTTPLFSALLIGVILILGALTFFPALESGPDS
jgi:K+-transporting ATPase ATPase A chain